MANTTFVNLMVMQKMISNMSRTRVDATEAHVKNNVTNLTLVDVAPACVKSNVMSMMGCLWRRHGHDLKKLIQHVLELCLARLPKVGVPRPATLPLPIRGAIARALSTRGPTACHRVAATTTWKRSGSRACRCAWAPARVSGVPLHGS